MPARRPPAHAVRATGDTLAAFGLAAVAAIFLSANLHAPVQRDGSHFLFMAINIAAGQPPYWASFETKNPLVEHYWALAMQLAAPGAAPIAVARVAEHLFLAFTAYAIYAAVRASNAAGTAVALPRLVAFGASALYLCVALDFRASDDGFNIALYQSLPEWLAIVAWLACSARPSIAGGFLAGLFVFAAWFTKQTSLLALAPPLAVALVAAPLARAMLRPMAVAMLTALSLAAAWFAALHFNGTLAHYLLGTMGYRAALSPGLWAEFGRNLADLFAVHSLHDPHAMVWQFHKVMAWLAGPLLVAALLRGAWLHRRGEARAARMLFVAAAWLAGSMAAAIAGLTFFRHYFLACLAPFFLLAGLLAREAARPVCASLAAALLLAVAVWAHWYAGQREAAIARHRDAPMRDAAEALVARIPAQARVFNWNGLLHYHAYGDRPSRYPLNMWWPWILADLPPDERDARLRRILAADPPDYFIEIVEQYPPNQGLRGFPLTPGLLETWTGRRYRAETLRPPRPGRYGAEVRVFRRADGPET